MPRRDYGISAAPIVAAVEPSTASGTADGAARLARELGAPLTFVHVRPRLTAALGHPTYQNRLTRDLNSGRHALDLAIVAANARGIMAHGEIIEGDAAQGILEFAAGRRARLLVVGPRRKRFGKSVSRQLLRTARISVVSLSGGSWNHDQELPREVPGEEPSDVSEEDEER